MAHLGSPFRIFVDDLPNFLVGCLENLPIRVLPAADQPVDLLGRDEPEPVEEVRDRVGVGPELAFGHGRVVYSVVFFAVLGLVIVGSSSWAISAASSNAVIVTDHASSRFS